MAKKSGRKGRPRPRTPAEKDFKHRLTPLRLLIFVGLALGGIGIGYGTGFILKKEQSPIIPVTVAQPVPASQPSITEPPVMPEVSTPAPETPPRAYEEALPREIIVHTSPPAPEPAPAKIIPVERKAPPVEPTQKEVAAITPVPVDTKPLPKIVIVIDDLGIDRSRTARIIQLPGPLTLSFMTYATELSSQTEAARKAGHELWMHIPMEPGSPDVDPGPNVLLTGIPEAELLNSLNWNLDQFSGYVGVNNHMGSRFTADRAGMDTIMKELKKRGLYFLDSITTGKTVGRKAAKKYGVAFAGRNIFLDHQDDLQSIEKRLREVEKLARKSGSAIAIGHPREATLKALGAWLKGIEAKGFRLVTLSNVIKSP